MHVTEKHVEGDEREICYTHVVCDWREIFVVNVDFAVAVECTNLTPDHNHRVHCVRVRSHLLFGLDFCHTVLRCLDSVPLFLHLDFFRRLGLSSFLYF